MAIILNTQAHKFVNIYDRMAHNDKVLTLLDRNSIILMNFYPTSAFRRMDMPFLVQDQATSAESHRLFVGFVPFVDHTPLCIVIPHSVIGTALGSALFASFAPFVEPRPLPNYATSRAILWIDSCVWKDYLYATG